MGGVWRAGGEALQLVTVWQIANSSNSNWPAKAPSVEKHVLESWSPGLARGQIAVARGCRWGDTSTGSDPAPAWWRGYTRSGMNGGDSSGFCGMLGVEGRQWERAVRRTRTDFDSFAQQPKKKEQMCCSWGTLAVNTPASPSSHWGKLKAEQTIAEICMCVYIYIYICARRDFVRKQGRKEALTIDHLQSWWAFPSVAVAAAAPAPILVSSRLVSSRVSTLLLGLWLSQPRD